MRAAGQRDELPAALAALAAVAASGRGGLFLARDEGGLQEETLEGRECAAVW